MEIWEVTFTVEDAKGQRGHLAFRLPDSLAYADVEAFAINMQSLVAPLVTGILTRLSIAYTMPLTGGSLASTADIEEKARLDFLTSNESDADDHRLSITIPTVDETIFTLRGSVDTSNEDVAAFVTAMVDGIEIGETTVKPSDSRGDLVVSYYGGEEVFRPRKRKKPRRLL